MPKKNEINVTFTFNIGKPEGIELLNRMVDIHNGGNGSPVKPLPSPVAPTAPAITEPEPPPTIETPPTIEPTAPAPIEPTAPAPIEPTAPVAIEPTAPAPIEPTAPVTITREQIGTALQNSVKAIGKAETGKILVRVTGVKKLSEIPVDKYADLLAELGVQL